VTHIVWAPQALEDVHAIRTHLFRDSADYADLIVERIVSAVSRLENHPRSGRIVPEIGEPTLREIIVDNYRVVYRLARDMAEAHEPYAPRVSRLRRFRGNVFGPTRAYQTFGIDDRVAAAPTMTAWRRTSR